MIGKRLAHYEIESPLGSGGMGDVYKARDTRLGRSVAVKVLPEAFAKDTERIARFEREAKVLASLNHPNIAALYEMEEAGGKHFLVMELVEGDTLAERIARGPIPIEEAFKIAHQIAGAFEAAHEKSVIHRDLKPANVKITPDDKVKVLDFGLAKALEGAPAQIASNSPTLLSAASIPGVILGTAGYMSPEQARGHPADQRSDIFSFGCVLFEMLTGRQTFQGETVSDVIAAVLKSEPELTLLPANLNPRITELVRRCLAKNRKDRWHTMADVRVEIDQILCDPAGMVSLPPMASKPQPLWKRVIHVVVTAIVVGVTVSIALWNPKPFAPALVTRFSLVLPEDQQFTATARPVLAISPDGSRLVYVANGRLFLRSMREMEAAPVPGLADSNVLAPFFSPDGHWIGFFSGSDPALKKIAITGGAAITICKVTSPPLGVTWDGDQILFIDQGKGVMRVSANGGEPEEAVESRSCGSEVIQRPNPS